MAEKKWEAALNSLNAKLDELSDKAKETAETAKEARQEAKESVDAKISEAKGDLVAAQERYRESVERSKSKASSELLKVQMSVEALQDKIQDKKDARDQKKLEAYIEDMIEYAADCHDAALLLLENARLAALEAFAAAVEYEEKYGEQE